MISQTDVYVFLLAFVGIACFLWANKRKFDRTNASGVEQFPSFRKKLAGQFFDAVLLGTGAGCLATAALIWVMEYAAAWGWAFVFLVIAFLIEKDYYRSRRRGNRD